MSVEVRTIDMQVMPVCFWRNRDGVRLLAEGAPHPSLKQPGRGTTRVATAPIPAGPRVSRREDVDWTSIRIHLYMRSGGRCEFCKEPLNNSAHVHHRKMRSQGGDHSPENLALICVRCHLWTHANPALAYEWGWLVSGFGDSGSVPIRTGQPWLD